MILKPANDYHWYCRDGLPHHDATFEEAMAAGYFPSATTILSVIKSEVVTLWQVEQAILATLRTRKLGSETFSDYVQRIHEESKGKVKKACSMGSEIHNGIDAHNKGQIQSSSNGLIQEYIETYKRENIESVTKSEIVLVDVELGVGGTTDLIGIHRQHGPVIIDFKSQSFQKKPRAYNKWLPQLSYYQRTWCRKNNLPLKQVGCMNVIINREERTQYVEHMWSGEEVEIGWQVFQAALFLWRWEKGWIQK